MKQNVKENGREQGLTDKDVARKFAKEQARTCSVSINAEDNHSKFTVVA